MDATLQNEAAVDLESTAALAPEGDLESGGCQVQDTAAAAPEQTTTSQGDTVTVLTTRGKIATKTFYLDADGKLAMRNYDQHAHYSYELRPVDGIGSLSALLSELATSSNSFVIRGEPMPETNPPGSVNRRLSTPKPATADKPAQPATYRSVARRWIALDLDKVPGKVDPAVDPEAAARYLIGLLPDEFHGVACHVQWTSSQGMRGPGTLSARLWYWLEEPADDQALRKWAKRKDAAIRQRLGFNEHRALLDASLYSAVQPHYTAGPIFRNDIPDPLPRRSYLLAGGAEAVRISLDGDDLPTKGLAETIRTFGEAGLWGSLKAIAVAYARETADEAERDPEKLVTLMREVMDRYDGPRANELPAYIADGAKLTDLATWTLANVAHIPAAVLELNKKHFVSTEGGKARIYNEEWDATFKRQRLTRSTVSDFSLVYQNRFVTIGQGGKKECKKLWDYWLSHARRRQYGTIGFDPAGVPDGVYNLWRGWSVEPAEGDWSLLKHHIRRVVCEDRDDLFDYFMNWLANLYQRPDEPGRVAIVLRGNKGAGKGTVANAVLRLCGQHGIQISNAKHLVGHFNAHLRDCVFLFADEAFWAGDKQGEAVLKTLITEDVIAVEPKGVDVIMSKNRLHILLASNSDWVVPVSVDDRRYAVFDVSDAHKQDIPYFEAIAKQMGNGGLEAMLHELLSRSYDPKSLLTIPQTDALREQQQLSMNPVMRWWYEKLSQGSILDDGFDRGWLENSQMIQRALLHSDFRDRMRGSSTAVERTDATTLGIHLRKLVPNLTSHQGTIEVGGFKERKWFWVFPSLAECRAQFDKLSGRAWDWPDPADCQEIPTMDPYENGFPADK